MDHKPRNRDGFLIGQTPVHHAVEVANGDGAIDGDRAIGLFADTDDRRVIFVFDLADDFLENIFKRHKALQRAIFIDDESEDKAETRAFLDRRIEGVMKFEKAKGEWLDPDRERFSLTRFLGRLRYPAR